jgi:DNA-binding NarL/FixJ family response regulator
MSKTKVVIVEDYQLFREGIKLILNNSYEFEVIAEFDNGKQFIDNLNNITCDVVLMDIAMPEMDGIEATRIATSLLPDVSILILSMLGDENHYHKIISAGAKGFLLKECKADEMFNAIRTVASGDNYFSQELLRKIIFTYGSPTSRKKDDNKAFSERELEVLSLLCQGLSNGEIADKLFISQRTVEGHRASMLKKTDTKNTISLIIHALRNNLIQL